MFLNELSKSVCALLSELALIKMGNLSKVLDFQHFNVSWGDSSKILPYR